MLFRSLNGGCQGSNNTNCNPHVTWGAKASSGEPSSGHFNQGSFNPSTSYPVAWAFGVRCVLDLNFTHCFKQLVFSTCIWLCSSARGGRVLVTVLHSARFFLAAVRAHHQDLAGL